MCGFGSLGEEWADPVFDPGATAGRIWPSPRVGGAVGWSPPTATVVCRGDAPYIGCPQGSGRRGAGRRGGDTAGWARVLRRRRGRGCLHLRFGRLLRLRIGIATSTSPLWTWPCDPLATGTGCWRRMAACSRSAPRRSAGRERRRARPRPAVSIAATPSGRGYWVATRAGEVLTFGDAVDFGCLADLGVRGPDHRHALVPAGIRILDGQRDRCGAGLRRHLLPRLCSPGHIGAAVRGLRRRWRGVADHVASRPTSCT